MGAATLLCALTLLSLIAPAISEPRYLVAFPAIIRHPSTERFCVHLMSLPETAHVEVTLEMTLQNHTLLEKDVEKPGTYECISFQVPAFVSKKGALDQYKQDEEVASLHVLIRAGDSNFEERKKVLVQSAFVRGFIHTDKLFYKPGETVRIRMMRLDEDFKAIDEKIPLIQLTDPNENRIGQWVDVKPQNGIVDLSFPLASEAAEGEYTIQMGSESFSHMGIMQEMFMVAEYVLPKFEVKIEFPELVTQADEEFQVKVYGKYTYGKPVHGNVHLRLNRELSYFFRQQNTNETLEEIDKEYTAQTDENGFAYFTINGSDLNLSRSGYLNSVRFVAELEEKGTGVTQEEAKHLPIAVNQVDVRFSTLNPFYKQGFPYTGEMRVSVYQAPVKNRTVYLTVDVDDVETTTSFVTDENGEASFSLDTTKWHGMVALRGRYTLENVTGSEIFQMANSEDYKWLKPFYSESNSFLEIQNVEEELPCGKDQEVLVDYIIDRKELGPDADHVDFYYLIVTRGKIISSGQKSVPVGQDETLKGTFSLILSTNSDLVPRARLLLYAVFLDGEVVADVDQFKIQKCFKHKVTLDFSTAEELPGSKVNLQVEAAPGALCSVHAVDKSVVLIGDPKVTTDKLFSYFSYDQMYITSGRGFPYRLEDFEPYPCLPPSQKQKRSLKVAPWYQTEADVFSLLKLLRLKVFTNMNIKKPVSCDLPVTRRLKTGLERGLTTNVQEDNVVSETPQAMDSTKHKKEEKAKPRTYFPETWLWDLVSVNEEGKATHSVTAPDTITEWSANAFCVADIGFGLSQEATFRVFQPFFVDMSLPYSVVRGETLQLKSTVFNYLKECIQVRVKLLESQEVDVKPCPDCQFSTCLCAEEAHTFSWNITATQLGHVNLSVTAEAEETHELCGNKIATTPVRGRSDTVVKALLVKPEGILEEETHNVFLCSSGDPVLDEVSLKLPEGVIEGSGRAIIACIGDILGATMQHLGFLVQMPLGCGEQNLMKFVPNIHILQYLEKTNLATPAFKEEVIKYTQSGYQRQLLYKRDNGSYSAFGMRDAEGNTWLTAAVVRGFGLAKTYIYIDEKHIQDAVHWLRQHQLPSGCFESVGRVFNNAIKGGVDDDMSLTAYVAASLLEVNLKENRTMVDDALGCLKRNLSSVESSYTKALLAYVFTLSGDSEIRQDLLKDLREAADKTDGIVSLPDMETTAYYLLALLSTPEVSTDVLNHASEVAPSLTDLQNYYGGFTSTQDTLIALQALSVYAALTYREIEDVKVLVKSGGGFQHEFHVGKDNRLVKQQAPLAEVPGQYKLEVSGNGCAYVQTALRYHKEPPPSEAFALSVETSPKECNHTTRKYFDVHVQVSYTGERNETNMVLIEVNMLSGYIPVKKTMKQLLMKPLVKKVEFEPDKIHIYLDKLDSEVQNYSASVEQETEVMDLKPAIVKVYDYYHPEDRAEAEYNAPCSTESTKKDHH